MPSTSTHISARALRSRWNRWNRNWQPTDGLLSQSDIVRTINEPACASREAFADSASKLRPLPVSLLPRPCSAFHREKCPSRSMRSIQRGSLIHDVH